MSSMGVQVTERTADVPHLKRVLSAWDLVLYGIVAVTPCAPATVYGLAERMTYGHSIVAILASMLAMVLTAVSYGRMAALYPSAGSVYTYAGRGLHPYVGFASGWAMLLEYGVNPLFSVMYATLAIREAAPHFPFVVSAAVLAGGITVLNLRGVRYTARANEVLTFFMFLVLMAYVVLAVRFVWLHQGPTHLFSVQPFYSPGTIHWGAMARGTSFAALTYLGFDAVTTLAEDVKNPKRNVMLSAVVVVVFTGVFGGLLVYLAQIVWPDYTSFQNIETAFVEVTRRIGGPVLFESTAALIVIANIGGAITTQVAAARLLFGMGRDNVIPRRFFGYLSPRTNAPSRNILLIGIVAFVGSLFMNYEITAEILNFGAFLVFMGVNLSVFWQFWVRSVEGHRREFFWDLLLPGLGFVFCTIIWVGLGGPAMIAGGIWFAVGIVVLAVHTSGFRKALELPDRGELVTVPAVASRESISAAVTESGDSEHGPDERA
jgi:putrescine importer